MSFYAERLAQFQGESEQLSRRYNWIGTLRFLTVVLAGALIYLAQRSNESGYWLLLLLPAVFFRYLMYRHERLSDRIALTRQLIQINQDELDYLNGSRIPFQAGTEHLQTAHSYSYDLDIFGEKSLYQHLNRTATSIGQATLAQQLLHRLPDAAITPRQRAVQELANHPEWRQEFLALGTMGQDTAEEYAALVEWSERKSPPVSGLTRTLAILFPALLALCVGGFVLTWDDDFLTLAGFMGLINLFILSRNLKQVKAETVDSERIGLIIKKYSTLIAAIESQTFQSEELQDLQQRLRTNGSLASTQVRQLSSLLAAMNGINHALAAVLTNGLYVSHVHTLHRLLQWKAQYAASLRSWLETIGTFESINSFANLSYNNPDFVFPSLSDSGEIAFKSLGHPLLNRTKRVTNDVRFSPRFMILTGSNMSGKSTFLRTLGINMLLTNVGSCVCATEARVQPLDILVSMRLNDSLADSESYFFAEVKRLQSILQTLQTKPCFILLDELFRGTNSDDKRNGTIEVIKKIIQYNAWGVIATHDLEVCEITEQYPQKLINKRFEVEIVNDELVFPYQLLDGICQNRSATFLMQKMGVI
ncbi:DNA mismatch repair protein [Siphonobacter sp. BAB-5405]|uniref:MutS-related protein n=1 Tax=Siphonobacter sp. BAB-5405 TaxID=1864825 RepID=UPI000C80440A|nr:DNA mismatch repair protein [Siphonobacter sp. BAB-5405]PMD95016.1 DNA mismatch repair protein [Siphonobacter sp. BAB-5405]